ncbi:hypothetical protein [Desulfurobacterium crinifex]
MKSSKLFIILFLAILIPVAAQGGGREDFERYCMECHGERVPPIYPADKLKEQWKEFFQKEYHKIHKKEKVIIPPATLRRIEEYVETYAADSDQPEGATF